jgi:hypothetical protein
MTELTTCSIATGIVALVVGLGWIAQACWHTYDRVRFRVKLAEQARQARIAVASMREQADRWKSTWDAEVSACLAAEKRSRELADANNSLARRAEDFKRQRDAAQLLAAERAEENAALKKQLRERFDRTVLARS